MSAVDILSVTRDQRTFFRSFFLPEKRAKVRPWSYFEKTFVPPPDFDEWKDWLAPAAGPRFITVEGQSRVGKTWTVVGATGKLLDERRVTVVLSSGEDSYRAFGERDSCGSVLEALEAIQRELERLEHEWRGQRTIVFLDDLLGSFRLRQLTPSNRAPEEIEPFFSLDRAMNPLLRLFADNEASFVVTARSAIMSTFKIRLGRTVVDRIAEDTRSLGFFQYAGGNYFVGRDEPWLEKVRETHEYFCQENKQFVLPYMIAFSSSPPEKMVDDPETSVALFGADFAEFSGQIALAEHNIDFGPEEQRDKWSQILERLDQVYSLYMAPGLMIPLPTVDAWILGGAQLARTLRRALYLQPEMEGEVALRVPNRFYLRALSAHLADPYEYRLSAGVLLRILRRASAREQGSEGVDVLVRGLLERGLAVLRDRIIDKDEDLENIARMICEVAVTIVNGRKNPLLLWECDLARRVWIGRVSPQMLTRSPGLTSAVGWAMYTFKDIVELEPERGARLRALAQEFVESIQMEITSFSTSDLESATVSYSNLLRWTVQMETAPDENSALQDLARLGYAAIPVSSYKYFEMVLEDALIWADGFQVDDKTSIALAGLPAAVQFKSLLRTEIEGTHADLDAWCTANRLFSLAWHNEWQEQEENFLGSEFRLWLDRFSAHAYDFILQDPSLLDENLEYHWCHLIAQWAVWTRDWCFTTDPLAYERDRRPLGCIRSFAHNGLIGRILVACLGSVSPIGEGEADEYIVRKRVRNACFLFGSRAGVLPRTESGQLRDILSRLAAEGMAHIRGALLEAIFELGRQGTLERPPFPPGRGRMTRERERGRKHFMPMDVRRGMKEVMELCLAEKDEAWESYRNELKRATVLDIIPNHWDEILPSDWN